MPETMQRVRILLAGDQMEHVVDNIAEHIATGVQGYRNLQSLELWGLGDDVEDCETMIQDMLPERYSRIVSVAP